MDKTKSDIVGWRTNKEYFHMPVNLLNQTVIEWFKHFHSESESEFIEVGKSVRQMLAFYYTSKSVAFDDSWVKEIRSKCVPSYDEQNKKLSLKEIILKLYPDAIIHTELGSDESSNEDCSSSNKAEIEKTGISDFKFNNRRYRKNIKVYGKRKRSQIEPAPVATSSCNGNANEKSCEANESSYSGINHVSGQLRQINDIVKDESEFSINEIVDTSYKDEFYFGVLNCNDSANYFQGTCTDNALTGKDIKPKDELDLDLVNSQSQSVIEIKQENPSEGTSDDNLKSELTSYKAALDYLKPLEDYALRKENYRAIGLVVSLENYFRRRQED